MEPIRIALLVSGGGTTAEQIILACCQEEGVLSGLIKPVCLIASKPGIGAIEKALRADSGLEGHIYICKPGLYPNSTVFGEALLNVFKREKIQWFGQHGWLPLTPKKVCTQYLGVNQHPAPVPYFGGKGMYGKAPHCAVLEFARLTLRSSENPVFTEAVAQLVAPEYDQGKIISSFPICLRPDDTPESLQQRVLPIEHCVQIIAWKKVGQAGGEIPLSENINFRLLPGEEEILEQAKNIARQKYPHG